MINKTFFEKSKKLKCVLFFALAIGIFANISYAQSNSYGNVAFTFKLTNSSNDDSKTTFTTAEEIIIKPEIENNSAELFPIISFDKNYLFKFKLTKVGENLPIKYRSDKTRILSIREETPGAGAKLLLDPIFPGQTQELEVMKLSDRYENLAPGSYKLTIEYKTAKTIQRNSINEFLRLKYDVSFEIVSQ